MNLLLRKAGIISPGTPFHNQQADIFIKDGTIHAIGSNLKIDDAREIRSEGLMVSPGWVDPFAHFCDPGFEYRETLDSGAASAGAGGYTDVFVIPDTAPFCHNKSAVEYIVHKSRTLPVAIHPLGAVTRNGEGKELAEMYDMEASGAVAFTDGLSSLQSAGVLLKALLYLKAVDRTIIQVPHDRTIHPNGLVHEGIVSTTLGLPGKPALAESLMVSRDVELARYTGSKIHFTGISTAASIEIIRRAKKEGLAVSCSVTPHHLWFCDEDLKTYDTNLKVNPPLRTDDDRKRLHEAVLDGTIDCIASHHLPYNVDEKLIEFEYARPGITGLQTAFAIVNTLFPGLPDERLLALFSTNARRLFHLPEPMITEGAPARLTLFSRTATHSFTEKEILSRSRNTPFVGQSFTGWPVGIINQDKLFLNQ